MSGLIHLYTGDGKGKTTAALGLAMRAAGRGKKVVLVQLCKGSDTGELEPLRAMGITVLRLSRDCGFFSRADESERAIALAENNANLKLALRGGCDMLVIDEAVGAYRLGAVDRELIDALLRDKPGHMELVLTGREPPEHFCEAADYVTEMRKIKHPFEAGIAAREGIEY